MKYNFEWDVTKAQQNYRKHKISFERAAEIFLDPFMLSIFDAEHSLTEDRWISIGKDKNDVPLVVIHAFKEADAKNSSIRIISTRRATKKEIKQYSRK
ncbi:MAG: BrnT family toxin [Bacteroidota bacterium]|nr:BrnT family toxin [Bacteroidota bacterium]